MQLRLNAELDAGALAAISDVEIYLRAPPACPSKTKKQRGRGNSVSGDGKGGHASDRTSIGGSSNPKAGGKSIGHSQGRSLGESSENTRGASLDIEIGKIGIGKKTPSIEPIANVSPRLGMVRGGGGGGTERRQSTRGGRGVVASADNDGRVGKIYPARGGQSKRGVVEVPSVARGGAGDDFRAAVAASPMLRVSERIKEAARASPERRMDGKARSAASSPTDSQGHSDNSSGAAEGRRPSGTPRSRESQQCSRPTARWPGPSTREVGGGCLTESGRGDGDGGIRDGNAAVNPGAGGVPAGIGEEATARFLKAKLTACQAQLEEVLQAHQSSQLQMVELRKQSGLDQEENRRLSRQLQQLQQANAKDAKAKEEDNLSAAALSSRVAELERELGSVRRAARQAETDKKSLEVRLHRAMEQISKQKDAVRQTRGQQKDVGQGHRMEVGKLEGQCQRLERQKLELLSAFKKQLKLIDVLKRQKFHVEAARSLAFTEEEFVKTLDWDSK
ncbi:unnamed protein product [Scytosiphon promiscuus]